MARLLDLSFSALTLATFGFSLPLLGCATASESDGDGADARGFAIVDSGPNTPDSPIGQTPDARIIGTPDAAIITTPDAMVITTPDAMGCTPVVQQLLSNENLDLGSGGGWIESGAGYPIVLSPADATFPLPITPQSGNFAAWMGGVDSATRAMYQDVVVPATATAMSVTGYRYIATEETSGVWDTWTATLRNTSNGVVETLGTFSNADVLEAWVAFTFTPSTNLAGQTVRLYFENTNDITNNTNFFVDSFALRVTVCQ